jgi:AcrR family transcriptional regulator
LSRHFWVSRTDIAREVGVTQAAIFRHFPTKAALWAEVGAQIARRLSGAWQAALATSDRPRDRLRALVAAQLAQIEVAPALPAILHSRELNVDNAALRAVFRGLLARFQTLLAAELAGMIRDGSMRSGIAPDDAAVLLTSLVQGVAIRWSFSARGFGLQPEGLRLLDVQLALFAQEREPT